MGKDRDAEYFKYQRLHKICMDPNDTAIAELEISCFHHEDCSIGLQCAPKPSQFFCYSFKFKKFTEVPCEVDTDCLSDEGIVLGVTQKHDIF